MSTVHAEIEIAASPQEVWDTVMDPDRLGDWVTIHKSVSGASEAAATGLDDVTGPAHARSVVHGALESG